MKHGRLIADERPAAVLRPAVPHAHREAGRDGNVPRPGGVLVVGARSQHRDPDAGHPARPGAPGRRPAEPDATDFELTAAVGSEVYGILSNPFLDQSFRTLGYRIRVTVHDADAWSYEEEAMVADSGPRRAVSSHRPQYAPPDRPTDTQPVGSSCGPPRARRRFARDRLPSRHGREPALNLDAMRRRRRLGRSG